MTKRFPWRLCALAGDIPSFRLRQGCTVAVMLVVSVNFSCGLANGSDFSVLLFTFFFLS
jgi:hypothetical protein